MKFTKPPLSIEQQIRLLQSRGMAIENPERTARYLINLTAHHCRLWNRRLVFTMTIPTLPNELAGMFNRQADRNIYNTVVMLGYLLKLISPGTSWPGRIKKLIEEYIPDKTVAMGFLDDWRGLPMWSDGI